MAEQTDDVLIIGDGPAGLTAALYLAKNGLGVVVLGEDKTPMHKAELHNQPGVPGMSGSEFMTTLREQCAEVGVKLYHDRAERVERRGDAFEGRSQDDTYRARYLVLATGRHRDLAEQLGLATENGHVRADTYGRTSVENVYAGGGLARGLTQGAISCGDGAAIAIDILSKEKGEPFHDYDVVKPPQQRQEQRA